MQSEFFLVEEDRSNILQIDSLWELQTYSKKGTQSKNYQFLSVQVSKEFPVYLIV